MSWGFGIKDFADEKYTRLCKEVIAESTSIELEGVINHFERNLVLQP